VGKISGFSSKAINVISAIKDNSKQPLDSIKNLFEKGAQNLSDAFKKIFQADQSSLVSS
jgi:hypothetical protein